MLPHSAENIKQRPLSYFLLFSDNAITHYGFIFSVRPPLHYLKLHIAFVTSQTNKTASPAVKHHLVKLNLRAQRTLPDPSPPSQILQEYMILMILKERGFHFTEMMLDFLQSHLKSTAFYLWVHFFALIHLRITGTCFRETSFHILQKEQLNFIIFSINHKSFGSMLYVCIQ